MTEQVNTLQSASKLGQQGVTLRAHKSASASHQTGHRRPVPPRDPIECLFKARLTRFGEPRTLEELVGHALKGRYDDENGLPPTFLQ